ncbi:MAG: M20/M25/M40 family metallo-hydrolase [Planctomycetota bacterium]
MKYQSEVLKLAGFLLSAMITIGPSMSLGQESPEAVQESKRLERVTYDIKYMSSDEMGGRQPGTPGIQLCEDYLIAEYKKAGLKPLADGTYLQSLEVGGKREIVKDSTKLILTGPNDTKLDLKLGENYQQLLGLRNFDLDTEVVFVGYGISADEHNYDEYQDLDVEGKLVVLIRREPQADDPESVFDGAETSRHASGRRKVIAARRAKAAGILMINDSGTAEEEGDELIQTDRFGANSLPFAHIKRSVFNEMLKLSPVVSPLGDKLESVSAIEKLIDKNLEPLSQPLSGWKADFESEFEVNRIKTNNVVGIIEGEGPNANETIVIGGHYDHLGMGGRGSRAAGRREIHNGADDNATGTAAILELARRFAASDKKPGRRLVFIAFTAEEMGLLGAQHYVNNPIFPLEDTVAMINFDMIGWLRDNKLTLFNWSTSPVFSDVFDKANEGIDFELNKPTMAFGGSDHLPFNQRQVPNMFIHTGTNPVYHTPEDDFEAINCPGALKVIDFSEKVVDQLASMEERPTYGAPKPFRIGVQIEDAEGGLRVTGVNEDSIAAKGGLQEGDIILEAGGEAMTARRNLQKNIQKFKGKIMTFKLKRDDAEIQLNLKLEEPK